MKKLSFWKLYRERNFCEKKTFDIKDLGLHTQHFFSFISLKSTLMNNSYRVALNELFTGAVYTLLIKQPALKHVPLFLYF